MRWLLLIIGCFTFSESIQDLDIDIHEKFKRLENRMYMLERRNEGLELKIENMQRDFDDTTENLRNHIAGLEKAYQELARKCQGLERQNDAFQLKLNEMQNNQIMKKERPIENENTKPERKTFQKFEIQSDNKYNKGSESYTGLSSSVADDEASGTIIGNADSEKKHSMVVKRRRRIPQTNVAFFATVSPHDIEHIGVNQNIVFENSVTNIGGAYNAFNGVFTVPLAGTYVFSSTLDGNYLADKREYYAHISVNGRNVANIITFPYEQATQFAVLQLSAGDTVSVRNENLDNHILGAGLSSFAGFLLY